MPSSSSLPIPAPILKIQAIHALLSQLCCSQGAPHTAILCISSGGAVIASQSCDTSPPFPTASLSDRNEDERARVFAAVGSSSWDEERGGSDEVGDLEPLMLETEVSSFRCLSLRILLCSRE